LDQTFSVNEASWQPLWEVNSTAGETSAILLINSLSLVYSEKREDPIFPANKTFNGQWYYASNYYAQVLACIDRTTICSPDESVCGSLKYWGGLKQRDTEEYRVLSMLYFSLLFSAIGHTVTFRKANGLDATRNLVGSTSLPLAEEQWKVEVQQLFKTSLARI
jgi:hypothetical protein